MNLIVDIDPYLKKSIKIKQFSAVEALEAEDFVLETNSGAINFARIFSMFDISSKIFTYLGGFVGDNYKAILQKEFSNLEIVNIKDTSREKLHIYDGTRDLNIYSSTPRLTNDERNRIYESFLESIQDMEYIILPTTDDTGYEEEFYINFINVAYKAGKKLGLSLNKNNINKLIKYKPAIVLVDRQALQVFADKELNFNWEINNVIKDLLGQGIDHVIYYSDKGSVQVQDGENIYSAQGPGFVFENSNKDKVLAGYIASLNKNYDQEMAAKIALATSNLQLKREELNRDAGVIKAQLNNIEVEQVNVR